MHAAARTLALTLLLALGLGAAIGDHAPSIPSTYVTTHPRLNAPDNAFLDTIWNGGAMISRYRTAADNWVSAAPGTLINCRRLLIAYLAERRHDGASQAPYLQKIQDLSTTVNAMGAWAGGWCAALAYDWTYNDLDATSRSNYRGKMYALMTAFETNITGGSPYNDQIYITGSSQTPHLVLALAIYPDDAATSLPHLRWAMDLWFNALVPVWKQVIGGGCMVASTDAATDCGGGWHESWEYVNSNAGLGMTTWYVPTLLSWWKATGDDIFTREPWIKNFAYWTMYQVRPDFTMERLGAMSRAVFQNEYSVALGAGLGSLEGLAAIYNDPTLRGWARIVNSHPSPDGTEPSAWPYYAPDTAANPANARSSLSKVRNFPGIGTVFFRTGWTEDDTFCTLRYGDNYWSHPVQDAGAFTCFNRGALAIRSGVYRPGSASSHFKQYTLQAISQNTILIEDSADDYPAETYYILHKNGSTTYENMPNDGGQRRVGSDFNVSNFSTPLQSPYDPAQWMRSREYYHQGRLVGYSIGTGGKFAYAAVDITPAYNNTWSRKPYSTAYNTKSAGTSNRSFRARKVVRHFLFIPRGASAYVVVYDQVISTNAAFTKKALLHFVNEPVVIGAAYTATRAELITAKPYPSFWPQAWAAQIAYDPSATQYQYGGKLYGWMTMAGDSPGGGTITKVGGVGNEFKIGATNYNECMQDQCTADTEGLGPVEGEVHPDPNTAPHEPGSWRIEQTVGASHLQDWFLNVMLMTTTGETNTVSTAPSTVASGTNWVTTWKDNADSCTYTLTLPKDGVGGTIAVSGAGCVATI